jgi:hypothetical protein
MSPRDIEYALARQVPEMCRGFTVSTNYGAITIPPGWIADRMQEHLERALRCELLAVHGTDANKAVA